MSKKKVIFIIPRMGGGGAERVVSIVGNGLIKRGYDIFIAVFVGNDSYYDLDENIKLLSANFSIVRAEGIKRKISMAQSFISSINFVKEIIRKYDPDVIVPLLTAGEIVGYFATIGNKKTARVSSERNDPANRGYLIRKFKARIYKSSNLLICQSKTVSDYYSFVSEDKKLVIPNPIDRASLPNPVHETVPLRIVSVGRLTPQKNMTLLVRAFALIANEFKEVTLTIYGEGPKRAEIEEIINSSNLQNRIFLPGASSDVLNQIKDAALFVMSSDFEGFPNALLEAMSLKIPVISTDFATGVAREIVTNDYGLVVPCNDVHTLANAMKKVLSDEKFRLKIRNQDNTELKKYDVERIIDMWDRALSKVIIKES